MLFWIRTHGNIIPFRSSSICFSRRPSPLVKISASSSSPSPRPMSSSPTSVPAAVPSTATLASQSLRDFCSNLASKQPTPGGGASAAVGAAIGAAASAMAGAYTQRKKDEDSRAAEHARAMMAKMDVPSLLAMADDDVSAYQSLQATWKKDCELTAGQVGDIQATALRVPTVLVEACHARILAIQEFLPHCNPGITSDAKVGVHQLAGAARAAFQTVLVNTPPDDEKQRLLALLREIHEIEADLLGLP